MKKNLFSFITLLIILVHTTTEARPDAPVLDINGNQLLSGNIYRPMPVDHGCGLVPYRIRNEICSYGVIQLPQYGLGERLIFTVNSSNEIYDYTDLDISFSTSISCLPSNMWTRGEYHEATKQYFIMIGGGLGIPGNGTIGNAFQIRKAGDDYYKFVFCPETCISCDRRCEDVGITTIDGVKRLTVGDGPSFNIRFYKEPSELKLFESMELPCIYYRGNY